jgi:hypothetical protein
MLSRRIKGLFYEITRNSNGLTGLEPSPVGLVQGNHDHWTPLVRLHRRMPVTRAAAMVRMATTLERDRAALVDESPRR